MQVPSGVVAYDDQWPAEFQRLRDRVESALRGIDHSVEHIGSTAVPGLAAKPIIDMDVVVPDQRGVPAAIAALRAQGWRHQGDLGVAGRGAFEPPPDVPYHHLYVVVAGNQAHRDHIDLRDFLRGHPAEAARYGALKRELAPLLARDRSAYVDGKTVLIKELLARARASRPRYHLTLLELRHHGAPGR